mgnify:CR=1 FL=1
MHSVVNIPLISLLLCLWACAEDKAELYERMDKVDAHVHIRTANNAIMEYAKSQRFQLLTVNTRSDSQAYIDKQKHFAVQMSEQYPEDIFWLTTFSMEGFEEPGWAEAVVEKLRQDLVQGALGFKIWKDIGMTYRDSLGSFVFLDDPIFEPILEFMAESGKPLLTHVGEPRNCWLPIDSMTVNNDKNYFSKHPEYHMYLHPEYPSHERLMESRDHVLDRYPELRVVGAHLGSLEWDVDVLAERLERYPNFAVDLAARVCHLQVQDREKVIAFIRKYQDRILYATDLGISGDQLSDRLTWLEDEWRSDWAYFATDSQLSSSSVEHEFTGLNLNEKVLKKIYGGNARHWYSMLD